jgi:hypothetical protein
VHALAVPLTGQVISTAMNDAGGYGPEAGKAKSSWNESLCGTVWLTAPLNVVPPCVTRGVQPWKASLVNTPVQPMMPAHALPVVRTRMLSTPESEVDENTPSTQALAGSASNSRTRPPVVSGALVGVSWFALFPREPEMEPIVAPLPPDAPAAVLAATPPGSVARAPAGSGASRVCRCGGC